MKFRRILDIIAEWNCIVFVAVRSNIWGGRKEGVTDFRKFLKRKDLTIDFVETEQIDEVSSRIELF